MDKIVGLTEIKTKHYGKIRVRLLKKNMICNTYFVVVEKNNKRLSGLVSKDLKEVIPFSEATLEELAVSNDNNNAYLGFKYPDNDNLEYYVLKAISEKTALIKTKIERGCNPPMIFERVIDNNKVWAIKMCYENPMYTLYSYEQDKVVSMALDDLRDINDKDYPDHRFYFEINLASNTKEKNINTSVIHSKLCGYLDEDGYISSNILDTESGVSYKLKNRCNTTSDEFKLLVSSLMTQYTTEYKEKEDEICNKLRNMFYSENPYTIDTKNAKILKFDNTRKNV